MKNSHCTIDDNITSLFGFQKKSNIEWRQWDRASVFISYFEHISNLLNIFAVSGDFKYVNICFKEIMF